MQKKFKHPKKSKNEYKCKYGNKYEQGNKRLKRINGNIKNLKNSA